LFNLTKYVEWPAAAFPETSSPIMLGILGEDNFGDDLRRMVEGKSINGRRLLLRRIAWGEDIKDVHLLFIGASEKRRLPEILDKLRNSSVLTVGDNDSFSQLGGIINLATKENRIRPQINLAAAERAGLKISSKLLSISDIVKDKPGVKRN